MYDTENREHQTYLRIKQEYENAKEKRLKYKRFGALFIIISGIVFLTLMFSLEHKIAFLILWVITDFYCAALMIRADYQYHRFAEYLGIEDEYTNNKKDEEAEE
jgi:putative membrane protein